MSNDVDGGGFAEFAGQLAQRLGIGPGTQAEMAAQFDRMKAADREMATCIARTFATEDGQKTLAWLKANTWEREEVAADLLLTHPPQQIMAHAIFRRGENSVVDLIEAAIADAEQKPRKRRTTG